MNDATPNSTNREENDAENDTGDRCWRRPCWPASPLAALAQDITLRATANSNENDEDYDGLVVFKNYVEKRLERAIEVELFIGTQLCSNGEECLQGVADGSIDIYISTSGGARASFPTCRCSTCPT